MLTTVCQRWVRRCARFVPPNTRFDRRRYEVAPIADDRRVKAFVEAHHYSGTVPPMRWRFGLYEGAELVGCAVFSVPAQDAVLAPFDPDAATDLGRFVLLDRVPFDAETWFLARCTERLPRDLDGFVMFSDPHPRTNAQGEVVFRGHYGRIYQGFNATFLGRSHADTELLLPDGRSFARRALSKIRARAAGDTGKRSRGWRYAVEQLVAEGAPTPGPDLGAWLALVCATMLRSVRHPGKFKYAFALHDRSRKRLPASLPYPRVARPTCATFEGRAVA